MNPSCFWTGPLMDASFKVYPLIMSTLSVSTSLPLCQRGLRLTRKTITLVTKKLIRVKGEGDVLNVGPLCE